MCETLSSLKHDKRSLRREIFSDREHILHRKNTFYGARLFPTSPCIHLGHFKVLIRPSSSSSSSSSREHILRRFLRQTVWKNENLEVAKVY